MRTLQTSLFILGVLCFLTAIAFIGDDMGDVLWRAGVAVMVTDIACLMIWPSHAGGHKG